MARLLSDHPATRLTLMPQPSLQPSLSEKVGVCYMGDIQLKSMKLLTVDYLVL